MRRVLYWLPPPEQHAAAQAAGLIDMPRPVAEEWTAEMLARAAKRGLSARVLTVSVEEFLAAARELALDGVEPRNRRAILLRLDNGGDTTHITSLRLTDDERLLLREAARVRGTTVADVLRSSAIADAAAEVLARRAAGKAMSEAVLAAATRFAETAVLQKKGGAK